MNIKRIVVVLCILGLLAAVFVVDLGFDFATGFTSSERRLNDTLLPSTGFAMAIIVMGWAVLGAIMPFLQKPEDQQPRTDA